MGNIAKPDSFFFLCMSGSIFTRAKSVEQIQFWKIEEAAWVSPKFMKMNFSSTERAIDMHMVLAIMMYMYALLILQTGNRYIQIHIIKDMFFFIYSVIRSAALFHYRISAQMTRFEI